MKCLECRWFCERNNFCRANPPVPMVVKKDGKFVVSSKFPVIQYPETDFCGLFADKSEDAPEFLQD